MGGWRLREAIGNLIRKPQGNVGERRELQGNMVKCRETKRNVGKTREIQGNIKRTGDRWGNMGRFRAVKIFCNFLGLCVQRTCWHLKARVFRVFFPSECPGA